MASHSKAPLRAVGTNSFKGDTKLVQVGRKDSHVLSHLHRQKTTAQSTAKHQHNRWNKASYTFLNSLLATPKVSQNKKSYMDSQVFIVTQNRNFSWLLQILKAINKILFSCWKITFFRFISTKILIKYLHSRYTKKKKLINWMIFKFVCQTQKCVFRWMCFQNAWVLKEVSALNLTSHSLK